MSLTYWRRLTARLSRTARPKHGRTGRRQGFKPEAERLEDRCLLDAGLFRTIDGTGNNLANPEWGSTNERLLRIAPAEYGNGISTPAGADRPSPRVISNTIVAQEDELPNDRHLSAFIYIWGQFLDHDLDLTTTGTTAFNIPVPRGDPFFDPNSTGTQFIPLNRSNFDPTTGTSTSNPRQQVNFITAWIDASMVYGSDAATAASLRTNNGLGAKLKTTTGNLPPTDALGNFLAGDIRANENIELTSMHTLFIREHNRLVDQIAAANPGLSNEELYQRARAIVGAEIQVITYREFLPALLGPNALRAYTGYNPNVNPGIANEFSAAGFRLHSLINDDVEFFGNDGRAVRPAIELREAFNNPNLLRQTGIDAILKYAASTTAQELDNQIVNGLRNFLFGSPGQGGLDLSSLNIQRGRDHGLADYNRVRVAYGLPALTNINQISSDPAVRQALRELYNNDVNNIDLWVGILAEDHVAGGSVGPLMRRIIVDQFERLRDGDRFWYQRVFSGQQLTELENTRLSDIIKRNTTVTNLQGNVFFFRAEIRGQVFFDINGDGNRDPGEPPLPNVLVRLLNDNGDVIAAMRTGQNGRYSFNEMTETGDFQVRIVVPFGFQVTTDNPQEVLISRGGVTVNGVDFGLRLGFSFSTAGPVEEMPVDELAEVILGSLDKEAPPRGRKG